MKEFMKRMMAAILIICGSIVLLTACSENDDSVSGNESGDGSVDATGKVVMMYYGIGGENLDEDTEVGLGNFAVQQMSGTGVRSFVQFKYSAKRFARWGENYEPSGDYGCVYRFEMNKNPGIHDDNPPYDDQYSFDYPDPNYYDLIGSK